MSTTAIPSPLNRIIATQRRVQTQHLRARPGKVPVRDPNEDDFYYQERQNNQSMKSPRPQSTGRFVSIPLLILSPFDDCSTLTGYS